MSIHVKTADGWKELGGSVGGSGVEGNLAGGGDKVYDVTNYNGTGETWRVHEFTDTTKTHDFIPVKANTDFRVLIVAGGAGRGGGHNDIAGRGPGNGGRVYENDAMSLQVNTVYSINVGKAGGNTDSGSGAGGVGSPSTGFGETADGGHSAGWSQTNRYRYGIGAGVAIQTAANDWSLSEGVTSDITGESIMYAVGGKAYDNMTYGSKDGRYTSPGSGATTYTEFNVNAVTWTTEPNAQDGIVIVAYPLDLSGVDGIDELPGIGGWATITGVTGNPTRYTYNDGSMDWVSFEWGVGTNTVTTSGGLLDVLIVGGGLDWPNVHDGGKGGGAVESVTYVESGPSEFFVSDRDPTWTHSWFEKIYVTSPYTWNSGAGSKNSGPEGLVSTIKDGNAIEYGCGGSLNRRDPGCGGWSASPGFAGTCIVRVPLANDLTNGQGSTPASVRAAVEETKQKISNREL